MLISSLLYLGTQGNQLPDDLPFLASFVNNPGGFVQQGIALVKQVMFFSLVSNPQFNHLYGSKAV